MTALQLFNRQKARAVDLPLLRTITRYLLTELLQQRAFELAVHLVGADEMTRVNEQFLQHTGSTDVITFDYGEPNGPLSGEIFICIDDAIEYARIYRTTWQEELLRYVVHGILHLQGYDDLKPEPRRVMKRMENRLVKALCKQFGSGKLEKASGSRLGGRSKASSS